MCLFLSKWITIPYKMEGVQCIQLASRDQFVPYEQISNGLYCWHVGHFVALASRSPYGCIVSNSVIMETSFLCPLCHHQGGWCQRLACINWPIQFYLPGCLVVLSWWRSLVGINMWYEYLHNEWPFSYAQSHVSTQNSLKLVFQHFSFQSPDQPSHLPLPMIPYIF